MRFSATDPGGARPRDGFVLLGQAEPPPSPGTFPQREGLPQADEPSDPDTGAISRDALDMAALFAELEPIRPEQVVLTLAGSAGGRLAERAGFLGLLPGSAVEQITAARDWRALLDLGVSVAQIVLLVQAEPWLPPVQGGVAFSDWLVGRGLLSDAQLADLHGWSVQLGWPLFQVALEQGALDEATYTRELGAFTGLGLAAAPGEIPRDLLVSFPLGWVEHFDLVPLARLEDRLLVAVAGPVPRPLLDRLATDVGGAVELRLGPPSEVAQWRRRWLRRWWEVHRPPRAGREPGATSASAGQGGAVGRSRRRAR